MGFLATLLVLSGIGCGKEAVSIAPPTVTSTTPTNGAVSVPVNQVISATFSEAVNPATVTGSTFTVSTAGGAVAGTVSYTATGSVATFTPSSPLAYNTLYTATITTGVANPLGIQLAANYVWTFTAITPPPTVTAVVPANGSTNVPISQALGVTFSEAMDPATITTATITLTSSGGAVTGVVTSSGAGATFTPSSPLAYNTVYTATVTTGAQDLAGQPLASNYVWSFTTTTPPPAVISTIPLNSATGVPVNQVISATFNEAVKCASLASPATVVSVTGPRTTSVAGTVACSGAVATFTPADYLAFNTVYTATITNGPQSLAGRKRITPGAAL
jgi:hypothetical protein